MTFQHEVIEGVDYLREDSSGELFKKYDGGLLFNVSKIKYEKQIDKDQDKNIIKGVCQVVTTQRDHNGSSSKLTFFGDDEQIFYIELNLKKDDKPKRKIKNKTILPLDNITNYSYVILKESLNLTIFVDKIFFDELLSLHLKKQLGHLYLIIDCIGIPIFTDRLDYHPVDDGFNNDTEKLKLLDPEHIHKLPKSIITHGSTGISSVQHISFSTNPTGLINDPFLHYDPDYNIEEKVDKSFFDHFLIENPSERRKFKFMNPSVKYTLINLNKISEQLKKTNKYFIILLVLLSILIISNFI